MRRRVLGLAAAAAALAAALWLTRAGHTQPNVLLVTIDTLRADRLGCYGNTAAATPVQDALAARGVRFATAIAHAPLTGPSHASLLTGLTPLRHGVRDNGRPTLAATVPTLAEAFRGAGWRTAAFVSGFPLDHRFGFDRGFESYDDRLPRGNDPRRAAFVERTAERTTGAVLHWLGTAAASAPWFLWVHYFDPHSPYEPPPEQAARFSDRPYDGEVAFVDAQLGRLLQAVEQGGPSRETLVLVTSDHGESLGEHGEDTHGVFIYDATLRVPLFLAGPGVPRGRVSQTVARGIDVAPTLLALAGAPALRGAEGRSLVPALSGEELDDAPAYVESLFVALNLGWAPLHGWRTARLKLIDAPQPELYALDQDPREQTNLAVARTGDAEALRVALKTELARAAGPASGSAAPDPGAVERLAALGYVGGTPPARPTGRDPKDGIALINQLERGLAEARANPTLAIAALEAVLRSDSQMPLARRYLAIARMAARDPQGAVREMEALAREAPLGPDDLLLLADHLRQAGRGDEALATVERALEVRPDGSDALAMRGRILLALGRAAEAREAYARALQRSAADPEALRGAGESALQLNDAAAAEDAFARILASDPEDAAALLRLGTLRVRAGRPDEARKLFLQVLSREPGNAEALLNLGGLLARSGQVREALPYLERAVQAGARSSVALNSLGFARLETGDDRGALAALRASLAQNPRQPDVQQAVARLSAGARQ